MHHQKSLAPSCGWEAVILHEWERSKVGSHWPLGFPDFEIDFILLEEVQPCPFISMIGEIFEHN